MQHLAVQFQLTMQNHLIQFLMIIFSIFMIIAHINWWYGQGSWAYNWNIGEKILPKANKKLQKIVGFLFWLSIYILIGVFLSLADKPNWFIYIPISTIFGVCIILITSLSRNSK